VRLFFVTSIYPPQTGGGASRIFDFATNIAAKGHMVVVFSYTPVQEMRKWKLFTMDRGVWVFRTPSLLPRNPVDQIIPMMVAITLAGIFGRPRTIILSVPAGEPSIGGFLASRLLRVKTIFDVRDEWEDAIIRKGRKVKRLQYGFYKALFTRLYAQASHVLAVTPTMVRRLQERGSDAILLPNGADTDLFQPMDRSPEFLNSYPFIGKDDFLVIYAGQVGWYYRLDVVIRSLAKLTKSFPDKHVKLIIMGNGEKLHEYKQLAEELGLSEDVIFTGEVSRREVAEVMNRCDLGVIPYDQNPLWMSAYGTKIFENCAAGLATVVSVLPDSDLERLVKSHQIGLVAEPLNIEQFKGHIETMIRDPEMKRRMRSNALKLVRESYSRRGLAAKLVELAQ
jgi:putative colanic acid biosynthesis glycosyltransferase WcaI